MDETDTPFFIDDKRIGSSSSSKGLVHFPPFHEYRENRIFTFESLHFNEFLDGVPGGEIANGQNGEFIVVILFLKILEVRKLRTTCVSPRLPEIGQDDFTDVAGE